MNNNPLLESFNTFEQVPPFDKIKLEHYNEAVSHYIKISENRLKNIINNNNAPTFENTIEEFEKIDKELQIIAGIFFNLNEADTSEQMQALAPKLSEQITMFSNEVYMNNKLFEKINIVHNSINNLNLDTEQKTLVNEIYSDFIKGGANLNEQDKTKLKDINLKLAKLSLKFNENVLAETNSFYLHISEKELLSGLPDYAIESAANEAQKRKLEGWVFTLHAPSYMAFMKYADSRKHREILYRAYSTRANKNDKFDNKEIIKDTVNLRLKKAQILGYNCYADMVLEHRMASNTPKVNDLLSQLFNAAMPIAKKEKEDIEKLGEELGIELPIQRWDWMYLSEKLKKARFDLSDEIVKPYFELNKVINAIFTLANKLYGLNFEKNSEIPVYHPEVSAYNIQLENKTKAILYLDFHPRETKSQGAWMTTFRGQSYNNNSYQCPHVSLVTNFTKSTSTNPTLLTFEEVTTFLHEFGHALHAILSDVKYESLSCTNVYRDFVELPSQIMENWALEAEWLQSWAVHYQTGLQIPEEIIEKIKASRNFNTGYATIRQLSFGNIDLAWHTITKEVNKDVIDFEKSIMQKFDLFPKVDGTAFCTAFGHIFAGGYAAGYYGYKWAEVLDADAFDVFKSKGIFNKQIAENFRKNILSKGGTQHPMILYKNFRGQEPTVDALLKRSGLI